MHPSVLSAWHGFSEPLEGRVNHLYADIRGLLTCGVGNLVDPVSLVLPLPWKHADGRLASDAEIRAEWQRVKAQSERLKKLHYKYAGQLTKLRLTDADIDALVVGKLLANERELVKAFPRWESWPADAQLAALSMAWAVGSGFPQIFKNFTRAINVGDFLGARAACKIKTDGNPGVIPRNKHNELCLANAAIVAKHEFDPSVLHWPSTAALPPDKPVDTATLQELREADELRRAAIQAQVIHFDTLEALRREALDEMGGIVRQVAEDDASEGGSEA